MIACSASKASSPCPARALYTGDLFRKALRWAEARGDFDAIKVLSAKYVVVDIDATIAPYDEALKRVGAAGRRRWAAEAGREVSRLVGGSGVVVAIAGRDYTDGLVTWLRANAPAVSVERPLAGLGIGEQKAWLKRAIGESDAYAV